MTRRLLAALTAVLLALAAIPASASTDTFGDDDGSVHETDIEAIAATGITRGCNPPSNDFFCPGRPTTRAEMATFLVRALGVAGRVVPVDPPDRSVDDENSVHESAIDALASLGITRGCNAVLPDAGYETVTTPDGPTPPPQFTTQLVDVRVGSAAGSDRVVFEFDQGVPGYQVGYIGLPVIEDASGLTIAVEGDDAIGVRLAWTSAWDLEGRQTYTGPDRFSVRLPSIAEVVESGDFERVMNWAIGVYDRPAFRVYTLTSPDRVVVEVAQPALFCPDEPVTRAQVAALLVRAFDYEAPTGTDRFVDDNASIFEADIEALAAAGITLGCNPPANDRFCPTDPVTRAQMASFLARALSL
ncbi:MAG: S-layer homology domain-containing protein [Acidimicrobiia bacterium]